MNRALAKEELERILDQAVQDVTERTAGVRLHQGEQSPGRIFAPYRSRLTKDLRPVSPYVQTPACCTVWHVIPFVRNPSRPKISRSSAKNILTYYVAE